MVVTSVFKRYIFHPKSSVIYCRGYLKWGHLSYAFYAINIKLDHILERDYLVLRGKLLKKKNVYPDAPPDSWSVPNIFICTKITNKYNCFIEPNKLTLAENEILYS